MSLTPGHLKYSKEHEWLQLESGDVAAIGITDYAQNSLGDIIYVELPEVGQQLELDKTFGVVESIKSVSDLYAPVSGEIIEVNQDLVKSPEKINQNAYESWMIKVRLKNKNEVNQMLDASGYEEICQ